MNFENYSKEWYEALEKAKARETSRQYLYNEHYSNLMSYDRFVFISELEASIMCNEMDELYARDLLNKYDKANPDAKF